MYFSIPPFQCFDEFFPYRYFKWVFLRGDAVNTTSVSRTRDIHLVSRQSNLNSGQYWRFTDKDTPSVIDLYKLLYNVASAYLTELSTKSPKN